MDIRGRGNSTWGFDKKPYRLRLDAAAALLGMPDSRHWVLLANHADKTLLRNDITFELGRQLGMAWTPRSRQVQVRLNGRYDGVYQLTEHIRIASQRVRIDELDPAVTGGPEISGGYLLQIDEDSTGSPACFVTAVAVMTICGEDPEDFSAVPAQRDYIARYMQDAENALFGPDFANEATGYAAYIDVESAIQYYLANELVKNVDGNLRRSTYLFKPRDGKLHFGPLWDFDLAIGNASHLGGTEVQGWYIRSAPWFTRLFEDPRFAERVAATWRAMKSDGRLDALLAYVDRRAIESSSAQADNFERWPIMDSYVFFSVAKPFPNSWDNEVAYLRRFLVERIAWIDGQLASGGPP
jgi:CotH kinase protein